jgi:DNA helicase-2/ATP-dependent DNA helicase PcrA
MNIALNERQLEAVEFRDGCCIVHAIPGSGKTTAVVYRIINLVKTGVPPESILGLTFTRSAASAMKEKLADVLGESASRVSLSTIHSFCLGFLKREGKAFDLLTGKDQIFFMKKVLKQLKVKDIVPGMAIRDISLAKSNAITVDEFKALYEGDAVMTKVGEIYSAYELEKEKELLLDLDDLLFMTYRLLKEDEEIKEKYQQIYRHIICDEFQDTNPLMQILIREFVEGFGSESSFWVCGDEMQSIFSFNGSSVGAILHFNRIYDRPAKRIVLDINYRSSPEIAKACENLMRHNVKKIDKELRTVKDHGDRVLVMECEDEKDEAVQVVNEILDLVNRKKFAYKDIAVLYRANFQARVMEEVFAQNQVPYRIESGTSFFEKYEVRCLIDYLRLIHNPDSDEADFALKSIVNVPNRYVSRAFLNELETHSIRKGTHFYQALKSIPIKVPFLKYNVKGLVKFLNPLIKKAGKVAPADMIRLLRISLDYDQFITQDEIPSADDIRLANLDQLELAAGDFDDIPSFLEHVDSFQGDEGNDEEGVVLSTVHKSKGLEYPAVFVINMIDGLMPYKNGILEEERRICFVALSRAMKVLHLSYPKIYFGKPVMPSQFLTEIRDTAQA